MEMKYRIDYVRDDSHHSESKKKKFFDAVDDSAAIQEYQRFQQECENLSGLISYDECRGLVRINADGRETKII